MASSTAPTISVGELVSVVLSDSAETLRRRKGLVVDTNRANVIAAVVVLGYRSAEVRSLEGSSISADSELPAGAYRCSRDSEEVVTFIEVPPSRLSSRLRPIWGKEFVALPDGVSGTSLKRFWQRRKTEIRTDSTDADDNRELKVPSEQLPTTRRARNATPMTVRPIPLNTGSTTGSDDDGNDKFQELEEVEAALDGNDPLELSSKVKDRHGQPAPNRQASRRGNYGEAFTTRPSPTRSARQPDVAEQPSEQPLGPGGAEGGDTDAQMKVLKMAMMKKLLNQDLDADSADVGSDAWKSQRTLAQQRAMKQRVERQAQRVVDEFYQHCEFEFGALDKAWTWKDEEEAINFKGKLSLKHTVVVLWAISRLLRANQPQRAGALTVQGMQCLREVSLSDLWGLGWELTHLAGPIRSNKRAAGEDELEAVPGAIKVRRELEDATKKGSQEDGKPGWQKQKEKEKAAEKEKKGEKGTDAKGK